MRHEERRLAEGATRFVEELRERAQEYRELASLLDLYGERTFWDQWSPREADGKIGEERAERLRYLLERL